MLAFLAWMLLVSTGLVCSGATGILVATRVKLSQGLMGAGGILASVSALGLAAGPLLSSPASFERSPPAARSEAALPVEVQFQGGSDRVWESLPEWEQGRGVELELVGLDTVENPQGMWTICIGLPDGIELVDESGVWEHQPEQDHYHPAGVPNRCPETTYRLYFSHRRVSQDPQPHVKPVGFLQLRVTIPGDYYVGLRSGKGIHSSREALDGPCSTAILRRSRP